MVLSRGRGEVIVCGEGERQIRFVVVEIRDGKVRIGVDAPKDIPVHRLEVANAIERQKRG